MDLEKLLALAFQLSVLLHEMEDLDAGEEGATPLVKLRLGSKRFELDPTLLRRTK